MQSDHGLDINSINDGSVFVPVLPLFEKKHKSKKSKDDKEKSKSSKDLKSETAGGALAEGTLVSFREVGFH